MNMCACETCNPPGPGPGTPLQYVRTRPCAADPCYGDLSCRYSSRELPRWGLPAMIPSFNPAIIKGMPPHSTFGIPQESYITYVQQDISPFTQVKDTYTPEIIKYPTFRPPWKPDLPLPLTALRRKPFLADRIVDRIKRIAQPITSAAKTVSKPITDAAKPLTDAVTDAVVKVAPKTTVAIAKKTGLIKDKGISSQAKLIPVVPGLDVKSTPLTQPKGTPVTAATPRMPRIIAPKTPRIAQKLPTSTPKAPAVAASAAPAAPAVVQQAPQSQGSQIPVLKPAGFAPSAQQVAAAKTMALSGSYYSVGLGQSEISADLANEIKAPVCSSPGLIGKIIGSGTEKASKTVLGALIVGGLIGYYYGNR